MLIIPMMLVVILLVYLKAKHATERVNHFADSNGWPHGRRSRRSDEERRSLQKL